MPAMACSDSQTRLLLHPERDAARHPRGLLFRNSAKCRTPRNMSGMELRLRLDKCPAPWPPWLQQRRPRRVGEGRPKQAKAGKSMPYVVLSAVPSSPILPSTGRCGTSGGPPIPTASPAPQPLLCMAGSGDAAPKHPTQALNLDDDPAASRHCPVILSGLDHPERHSWILHICCGSKQVRGNQHTGHAKAHLPAVARSTQSCVIGWACG